MPPCQNVLSRKIFRTKILTSIIKNAKEPAIDINLSEGWYVDENGKLAIDYFSGNPYPENITEITSVDGIDDDDSEDDYASESDSDICDSDDDN